MEARVRNVEPVVVGGHQSAEPLERRPVADGSTPDAERAGLELEVVRRDRARAVHEDLATARVDDGVRVGMRSREGVERRDARSGDLECQSQAAREREPDPCAREAAGPGADDQSVEVFGCGVRMREQLVDVAEKRACGPRAFTENAPVLEEGARRDVCCGVEREDEHSGNAF